MIFFPISKGIVVAFLAHSTTLPRFRRLVGIAQLVRAPDCDSGCRGFESRYSPHFSETASRAQPFSPLTRSCA
jgi:hypothetical protein